MSIGPVCGVAFGSLSASSATWQDCEKYPTLIDALKAAVQQYREWDESAARQSLCARCHGQVIDAGEFGRH